MEKEEEIDYRKKLSKRTIIELKKERKINQGLKKKMEKRGKNK